MFSFVPKTSEVNTNFYCTIMLFSLTFQSVDVELRCRFYGAVDQRPKLLHLRQPKNQYHFSQTITDGPNIAMHNCLVSVVDGQHTYQYQVFFRRNARLQKNQAILTLLKGVRRPTKIRGNIIVMRIGTRSSLVNMRERDTILADWVIKE